MLTGSVSPNGLSKQITQNVIDRLSAIAAQVLSRNPRLIAQVNRLAISDDHLQRLFGLVTLIIASREEAWRPALVAMADRLSDDADPEIKTHLSWARRRMSKLHFVA